MHVHFVGENTGSNFLSHSKKMSYNTGHRKYLPPEHSYRRWKKTFNGEQEFGYAPIPLTGSQILENVSQMKFEPFGKRNKCKGTGKGKGKGKSKGIGTKRARVRKREDDSRTCWKIK